VTSTPECQTPDIHRGPLPTTQPPNPQNPPKPPNVNFILPVLLSSGPKAVAGNASGEQRVCGKLIDTAPKCLPILLAAEIVGSRSPELRGTWLDPASGVGLAFGAKPIKADCQMMMTHPAE